MNYDVFRRIVLLLISFFIFFNSVFGSNIPPPMLDNGNVPSFLGLEQEEIQSNGEPVLLFVDPVTVGGAYLTGKAILGLVAVAGGVLAGAGLWDLTSTFRKNFVEYMKNGWSYYADIVARLPGEIYNRLVIMGLKVTSGIDFIYDNAVELANGMGMAVDEFLSMANDVINNGIDLTNEVLTNAVAHTVEGLNTAVPNVSIDFPDVAHEHPIFGQSISSGNPYDYKTIYIDSDYGNCRVQATEQIMFPSNVKYRVYTHNSITRYNYGWFALQIITYYLFESSTGKRGTIKTTCYKKLTPNQILDYRVQPYIDRSYDDTYTGYLVTVLSNWGHETIIDGQEIPIKSYKTLYNSVFSLSDYSKSSLDANLASRWANFSKVMADNFDIDMVLPNSISYPYYLYFDVCPFDTLPVDSDIPIVDALPAVLDIAMPFPNNINVTGKILSTTEPKDDTSSIYDMALDNVYNAPSGVYGGSILTDAQLIFDTTGTHDVVLDDTTYTDILSIPVTDYPYERDVVIPANPFDVANTTDVPNDVDVPIGGDMSLGADTVSTGVLDALLKWLNSLIQALKNLLISLFIPEASFFDNWFYKIKTAFANKLGYDTYLDLLKGLATIKAIPLDFTITVYGQTVTIIDVNIYARFYDIISNFIKGFVYVFLLIFYLNNIYKFIRRDTFTHISDSSD